MSKLSRRKVSEFQGGGVRQPAAAPPVRAGSTLGAAMSAGAHPTPVGSLQRARRLGHNVVQTKLTLGPADDPYERQADATARSVMQWLSSPQPAAETASGGGDGGGAAAAVQRDDLDDDQLSMKRLQRDLLQRDDLEDPEELSLKRVDGVQRQSIDEEPEELSLKRIDGVQRQSFEDEDPDQLSFKRLDGPTVWRDFLQREEAATHGPEGGAVDPGVESSIDAARGGGSPLADTVRGPMEQAFGADFSGVKVHDDSRSHQLNRSLSSRSFATGSHIFMGQGEYSPGSSGGQELLAHELTHVVQQGAAQAKRDEE